MSNYYTKAKGKTFYFKSILDKIDILQQERENNLFNLWLDKLIKKLWKRKQ